MLCSGISCSSPNCRNKLNWMPNKALADKNIFGINFKVKIFEWEDTPQHLGFMLNLTNFILK